MQIRTLIYLSVGIFLLLGCEPLSNKTNDFSIIKMNINSVTKTNMTDVYVYFLDWNLTNYTAQERQIATFYYFVGRADSSRILLSTEDTSSSLLTLSIEDTNTGFIWTKEYNSLKDFSGYDDCKQMKNITYCLIKYNDKKVK